MARRMRTKELEWIYYISYLWELQKDFINMRKGFAASASLHVFLPNYFFRLSLRGIHYELIHQEL